MSALGRAFLRMAAVAALRNKTIVGDAVYDSRIAAFDPETFVPNIGEIAGSIGVYTEQDSGDALAAQNGGPPFRPEIELVLEIAMQVKIEMQSDVVDIVFPQTDDQLEITIDAIEDQAERALFKPRIDAGPALGFFKMAKQVSSKTSIRFTNPAAADRVAVRYVTYKVEIADLALPIYERNFVDNPATPLLRLPALWRDVIATWPADSVETEKATRLAELLAPPDVTPLEGVDVKRSPDDQGRATPPAPNGKWDITQ